MEVLDSVNSFFPLMFHYHPISATILIMIVVFGGNDYDTFM